MLLSQQSQLAAAARLVEVASSALAAEIALRSRPELGYDGLSQKMGARTPDKLVQKLTGVGGATARRMVRVGVLTSTVAAHDADPTVEVAEPWLAAALRAVASGALSNEAVDAIRLGLRRPSESVSADSLAAAVDALVRLAPSLNIELLAARAREFRDDLDVAGVAEREEERRARRYLWLIPQRDGMTRVSGLLDPESAAVIKNSVDAATSPKRGGPRFVNAAEKARADALEADPRTPEQLAVDALVELVDIAVRAHGNTTLGVRRADVRMIVSQRDLESGVGVAFIEGQSASVSIETAQRFACEGGIVPVLFNDRGQSLNVGQAQRYHTAKQRIAIATRDGGCVAGDCERPASWCEVHHINEFSLGGDTSVQDGVLLCRHHHLNVHNNHWRITREGDEYWMVPPPGHPNPEPILLRTKSAAMRRLLATA